MIDQEGGCQHTMTGNTVLPMTLMFLGNRDDFHITIKAPFLKYIPMDERLGINEEKPGIYKIHVQEEETLQQVLVDVQNEIRDKMNQLNKEEPESEVFLHLEPTDEIIIEMPLNFRPLILTDVPGTSEGGPMGQWMRDAAAYQKSKAHLELHVVDAGSSGVEMYIKKTEETTEEAQVSNEQGQKLLLLVNKVKGDEHIEEIKKKFRNSEKDQKNVMYTNGMNLLAHQLLQTEKELSAPLSKSEIENEGSAEKQKLLYQAAVGDFQNHKDFVRMWDRNRNFLQEDIEKKCSACDNFALLSFLETAASQHWAKCSERLLQEAAMHYDEMAATYSMRLNVLKGKFDKQIEELKEFERLDDQKRMEHLKETQKYKEMKKQLEDGIKILQNPPEYWDLELLRNGWHERCVEDLRANASRHTLPRTDWSSYCQKQVCQMMLSKLFNEEEEEETTQTSFKVWDPFWAPILVAAVGAAAPAAVAVAAEAASSLGSLAGLLATSVGGPAALGANILGTVGRFGARMARSGTWGEKDLSSEAIERKILETSLKLLKENAPKIIAKYRQCKADTRDTIAALELWEAHWKMKAAALRKFAKATFGPVHAQIL